MPFTVVDFNNFWSPSGGGVRRYCLEKMAFYENRAAERFVFVMPDSKTFTEKKSESLIIEHIKAFRFPGKWEYRFMWKRSQILPILKKYVPDIIEVGSPYILPSAVYRIARKVCPRAKLFGFWHADFPVTYVERPVTAKCGSVIGTLAKKIAFAYARFEFKHFAGIEVSSEEVRERLIQNRLPAAYRIPLGCDIQMFAPNKRDESLVQKYRAGNNKRPILFFPHRFCEEKGVHLILKAYPEISKRLGIEPTIIFAGTGPLLPQVLEAEKQFEHIHYIGFVSSVNDMARYYASSDFGLALSGYETFGLSILESFASGLAQIAAPTGAAGEHVRDSQAGLLMSALTAECLTEKITELLQHPLTEYAKKARAYAEQFSWEACFERQLELYKNKTV